MLNQRLHFPGTEKMETIERFAITQGRKNVQTRVEFFRKRKN